MLRINKNSKLSSNNSIKEFDWNKEYFPTPGMLGTEYVGSDRYAVVCLSVDSPKRITIARLWDLDEYNVKNNPRINIDDEGVMYLIDLNTKIRTGEKWSLRTNKNGYQSWKKMNSSYSTSIHWGIADPYRDPSF